MRFRGDACEASLPAFPTGSTKHSGPRAIRFARDALALAAAAIKGVLSRPPVRPLADEARRQLPGDALLPSAKGRWTHGITIQAPPSAVWPRLLQVGCRRGGDSYDRPDNGGPARADRIRPELQQIEVGDLMASTPGARQGIFVASGDYERTAV